MFKGIKSFLNWPNKGINNINELGNYAKANWLNLLIMIIIIVIIWWAMKKVFSFISSLFGD